MVDKNYSDSQEIKKKSILPPKKKQLFINNMEEITDSDDDEDASERIETSSKVKYLPPSVIKDIEQKNVARKLAGLPPILTRIRHCLTCGAKFQSAGNRTCGCASRIAGIIAGREII